ncbi:MAG: hypothetical protein INR71_02465 [Terriglobus roseus]|nr:hypothetical protein [Terriglobus roseus]
MVSADEEKMYQNQFQKYNPLPLTEVDIQPHVVSDDGPMMAPWVCRAAMQRSVGKILYHAGFEEFQPSAIEAVTDLATDFFGRLVNGLTEYREEPKVFHKQAAPAANNSKWLPKYTKEEAILHALHSNGLDMEGLETYVRDDVDRLGSKLGVMHDRMKSHLAELLVSVLPSILQFCLTGLSDPRWMRTLVRTVSALSMTEASNLWVATSPRTSTKTSSASKSLDWTASSGSHLSVYLCTSCRTACTTSTSSRTQGRRRRRAWSWSSSRCSTRSRRKTYPRRLGWCRTFSCRSCTPPTTSRSSRTRTCQSSSASRSPACRPRARSRARASGPSASSSSWPSASASSRRRSATARGRGPGPGPGADLAARRSRSAGRWRRSCASRCRARRRAWRSRRRTTRASWA